MKIETPVLRRLGPIPFWRGERKCLDALEEIYRKVRDGAARNGGSSDIICEDKSKHVRRKT